MEYKGFVVKAFERGHGTWRAIVRRTNRQPLKAKDHKKKYHFVIPQDAASAVDALLLALDAIDSGFFARNTVRSTEKFWRRHRPRHASNVTGGSLQGENRARRSSSFKV
jgi:hypothetical protein